MQHCIKVIKPFTGKGFTALLFKVKMVSYAGIASLLATTSYRLFVKGNNHFFVH